MIEFFYIYILYSLKDNKLYIGYTSSLEKRIKSHIAGKVTSTIQRLPLKLIYVERYISKKDAKNREKFLKSGFGRRQLKKSLKETLTALEYKHM